MNPSVLSSKKNEGAVLLVVLWAIVILGSTTMIVLKTIEWDATNHAIESMRFEAYQAALSGLQIGLNPESNLLQKKFSGQDAQSRNFEISVSSESAKININRVLQENRHDILERIFIQWRIPSSQINGLIDRIADWVDSDHLKRLNGAESQDYLNANLNYTPSNQPFRSLDEINQILGINHLKEAKPDWSDNITIYGDGRLDINQASKEILMSYLDLTSSQADTIIAYRENQKKQDPSSMGIKDINQIRNILGYNDKKITEIEPYITFSSDVQRVVSTGFSGKCQRVVTVVLKRNENGAPEYYSWDEK